MKSIFYCCLLQIIFIPEMSQNNKEEYSVQEVFNVISSYLQNEQLYERLLTILHEDANYKRLLETGENQFFDGPTKSTIEEGNVKSRSDCPEINKLVVQVDDSIDKIVREKFQGQFLDKLKDEVLQAILLLSSNQTKCSDGISQPSTSQVKSRRGRKKKAVLQSEVVTNNCIQNGSSVQNEGSNAINGQAKPVFEIKLEKDDVDADLRSLISLDSVSSVHTSDLSSFEDEISISSEEDFGQKRKLSLKEVREKLEKSKSDIDSEMENEEVKSYQTEKAQSNFPININGSSLLQKSPRRRKQNSKYIDDNILVLPIKKRRASVSSQSLYGENRGRRARSVCGDIHPRRAQSVPRRPRSVCGDAPKKRARSVCGDRQRKRGRPKTTT